ncbi:hypothetical protein EDB85DRAFT_2042259 [Lactarius pseudohatsudake]|nr:hypothetical protein EDB85DRAFT_2042259 [Lactarius pseudohatsudake]
MWSSLATFLGSQPWSCAICTSSDCAISALCMPKGTRSVSKLVLSMSVSAILGLAWMLGVQTGSWSWSWTGGTDKNSGHATHAEDNADRWIRFRSSMHQWAYSGWRQQHETKLN